MTDQLSRRQFLATAVAAGAGLTVAATLTGCGAPPPPDAGGAPLAPNAWVRVRPDGTVLVMVDRSEMGQGIATGLAMLVAEELDADWPQVRYEAAPAHPAYENRLMRGMQGTGGSTGIMNGWLPLRRAGAQARRMLVQAAATRWDVPADECRTAAGAVHHDGSGRVLSYGELCEAAGALPVPETVALKAPAEWRLIGRPMPRLDTPKVVRGEPIFAGDVRVAGMLVAMVERCPVVGGTLAALDDAAARAVPGVRGVVRVTSGVAVVADDAWAAQRGRAALACTWDEGPRAAQSSESIAAALAARAAAPEGKVVRDDGDVDGAFAGAARTLEATYELPYLAHATMEPMVCAADVRPDGATVWAPTQMQWGSRVMGGGAQGHAARAAGLEPGQVQVITTQLGGGFGRRAEMDFVIDAVEVSKAVGAPVRVVWSREDDIRHDFYRPVARADLRAALAADGRPLAVTARLTGPSILRRYIPGFMPDWAASRIGLLRHGADPTTIEGVDEMPYAFPALRVDAREADLGVPVGFWRSVGNSQNAFIVECFVDELAHAAGADPVAFRRELLAGRPRHLAVLDRAAERAGWGTPLPAGRARGVALHASFGSIVAQVAEVSREGGRVRVHRVTCAIDCGIAVNPDSVAAQMEGSIAYGLGAALHGRITLAAGRVQQSNFHDYPVLRMNEMPAVDVHIVPSPEPPGGVGEPGTPPIAPAVANALFGLTGERVRVLPLA